MRTEVRQVATKLYGRLLEHDLSDGHHPRHVAVIQDGNRRYARSRGEEAAHGHRAGAETTEQMLEWCADLGVEELTLYSFSTENFDRPPEERAELFDLMETKLRTFVEQEEVHEREVRLRVIGETHRLPQRIQDAIEYAERQTAGYDRFRLNVALAYGGRAELLGAARSVAAAVEAGDIRPADVDTALLDDYLDDSATRDVDLIIRTGGDERTSNFLPWHANGNEAAVYFCAPYWPEFRKIDFLRAVRTYQARERSWRQSRTERALALVRLLGPDRSLVHRLRDQVGEFEVDVDEAEVDAEPTTN